jgi:RAP1 GTPase activating protein 1
MNFRPALSESDDSSLNSVDLDAAVYVDSDTGLESMSSAETPHKACSLCLDTGEAGGRQAEALRHEVTRLKCDKLDLLRQNVVSEVEWAVGIHVSLFLQHRENGGVALL